jgi:hypothetical protein
MPRDNLEAVSSLEIERSVFDSGETQILSAVFEKAWAYVEFDPMLGLLEACERQSELARCPMALTAAMEASEVKPAQNAPSRQPAAARPLVIGGNYYGSPRFFSAANSRNMFLANSRGVVSTLFRDFIPCGDFTITIPFHSAYEPVIVRPSNWIVSSFQMKGLLLIAMQLTMDVRSSNKAEL